MTDLLVYVARYGRQSIDDMERWTPSRLRQIAAALHRLIQQEGGGLQED